MDLITLNNTRLPVIITNEDVDTQKAFLNFFTASIGNSNTRQAYFRNCKKFLLWAQANKLALKDIEPFQVAAYRELLNKNLSAPSVKQHLSALKMFFNFMVDKQSIPFNPAAGVRPP